MALFEKPAFLLLLLIVLLLFGAKRLPDLARGVGRSMRIFKAETQAMDGSSTEEAAGTTAVAAPAPRAVADVAGTVSDSGPQDAVTSAAPTQQQPGGLTS